MKKISKICFINIYICVCLKISYTCIVKSFGMMDLTLSAKAPHGVVWTAGSAQLKALQAPKISRKSINQELITWGISNFFAPNSPPGLPTLGDDSKFQPKIQSQQKLWGKWMKIYCKQIDGIMEVTRLNDSSVDRFQGPFSGFKRPIIGLSVYTYIYMYIMYIGCSTKTQKSNLFEHQWFTSDNYMNKRC